MFREDEGRHVKDLKFTVVHDENKIIGPVDPDEDIDHDQLISNAERARKKRTPVDLEDLFEDRALEPNGEAQPVRRLLLFGNAGSGKTSLTKKLAHDWALEAWGACFCVVYVLPMRDLNEMESTGEFCRNVRSVADAILELCFPCREEEEYDALIWQIIDDLRRDSTLLIMDGLDEGNAKGNTFLDRALETKCHVLLSSRPYNMRENRKKVQVEIECVGLSQSQLEAFVRSELPPPHGEDLLRHLFANPIIQEFARVPITANILCFLWNERQSGRIDEVFETNLASLYRRMTNFVFRRFCRKFELTVDRDSVFSALGCIALKALERGKIQISEDLVAEHGSSPALDEALKHVGFLLLKLEGMYYQFAHLSFQEYFGGTRLAEDLFKDGSVEQRHAMHFVAANKFVEKYENTISFMVEAVCAQHRRDGFDVLMSMANDGDSEETRSILFKLKVVDAAISSNITGGDGERADPEVDAIVESAVVLLRRFKDDREELPHIVSRLANVPNVVKACPSLFHALLECLESRRRVCRNKATEASIKLARMSPNYTDAVMKALADKCREEDTAFPGQALSHMEALAAIVSEDKVHEILDMVFEGCRDMDDYVRFQAFSQLEALSTSHPKQWKRIVFAFKTFCADEDSSVRNDASKYWCAIARKNPDNATELLRLAKNLCDIEDPGIRSSAVSTLHMLAAQVPKLRIQVFECLKGFRIMENMDLHFAIVLQTQHFVNSMPGLERDVTALMESIAMSVAKKCASGTCQDQDTLLDKLSSLVRVLPAKEDDIFDLFLNEPADANSDVHDGRCDRFVVLARTFPHKAHEIFKLIEKEYKDTNLTMRETKLSKMSKLARGLPKKIEEIFKMVAQEYVEGGPNIRNVAFGQMLAIAQDFVLKEDEMLQLVEKECSKHNRQTSEGAFEHLLTIGRVIPKRRGEVFRFILKGCIQYDDPSFQKASQEILSKCGEEYIDVQSESLELMAKRCTHQDSFVRKASIDQLFVIMHVFPKMKEKGFGAISNDYSIWNNDVRLVLFDNISALARDLPHKKEEIMELVRSGCRDDYPSVRQAAFGQLSSIARDHPDKKDEIVELVRSGCRDDDWDVRQVALMQLSIIERSPRRERGD